MSRLSLLYSGAAVFIVLSLLNVGGYQYGVSDQAFYIPILLQGFQPELYPHNSSLLAAQDRFFAFDDLLVPILRTTGISISVAFLIGYGCTLTLLYSAAIRFGKALHMSYWTVAGVVIALTMRHRIPYTPVNTLESYFHPRLLAFAVGVTAAGVFLKGRTWLAFVLLGLSFLVHPTTAVWFAIWLGTAALFSDQNTRRLLIGLVITCLTLVVLVLTGPLGDQLIVMDQVWVQLLTAKDYLIPTTDWSMLTWIANLTLAVIIGVIYRYRLKLGIQTERESGLVAGCGALLTIFLLSLPLSAAHVALVVQLQFSRIFWLLDLFATIYVCWWAIESPLVRQIPLSKLSIRRSVVAGLVVFSLARGTYVMFIEHQGHPLIERELPTSNWNTVMEWAADRPVGTHFLADPGHAWRYGSSVRTASGRDVYLEEVKDVAIAIYSREIAHEITQRISDLGNFDTLDAARARKLAHLYKLDYLITKRFIDLPQVHETGQFKVYSLQNE